MRPPPSRRPDTVKRHRSRVRRDFAGVCLMATALGLGWWNIATRSFAFGALIMAALFFLRDWTEYVAAQRTHQPHPTGEDTKPGDELFWRHT